MGIDQVFQLLDKGFSRDDIMMLMGNQSAQPEPQSEPQQDPIPEPQQDPIPEPQPEPGTAELEKRMTGIEASIEKLVKTIQASNLQNATYGSAPDSLDEQTDKIMASIIRPEQERK